MTRNKTKLIPRNNWDYNFFDLIKALWGILNPISDANEIFKKIFLNEPIFTTSGRASLYAILKSLNLPSGAKVGVPLFCCSVVFDTIKQAGLNPVFIDISPDDYNLSAADLAKKRNALSAIIVVHMFGHPVDMDSILLISKDIPVIEDCAHSLFSKYKNQYTGTLSTASFFSFRSGKYLSVGEGSVIFCKDPSLNKSIKSIVDKFDNWKLSKMITHCISTYIKSILYNRPWYGILGYPIGRKLDIKFNLSAKTGFNIKKIARSDLRIICDRIKTFYKKVEIQRENTSYLKEKIKLEHVSIPNEKKGCFNNCYQFPIRFENSKQRDSMAEYLHKCGIDTAKYLDTIVDEAILKYGYKKEECPNAEILSKTTLLIPTHYTLNEREIRQIAESVNQFEN